MRDSKKKSREEKYLLWWIFLYFFVPLIGLMILFEFFHHKELSKFQRNGFHGVSVIWAALVWAAMSYFTKGRTVRQKAIAGVLLFLVLVVLNVAVRLKS